MREFIDYMEYDESCKMVKKKIYEPGYHSTLTNGYVHPTRESAEYALSLLQNGEHVNRAMEIIEKIMQLQELDHGSEKFGLWSYFLEESIADMNPPDDNWANFVGKNLLMIDIDFGELLPVELRKCVKKSVLAACKHIFKRNCGVGYTNIAVMDSFMTAVAGEYYDVPKYFEYGVAKMESLYWFTKINGDITEYNSPVYTAVAIGDLCYFSKYIKDTKTLEYIKKFNRKCWECIASHFHVKTGQWCGPQARNYTNFLTNEQKSMLQYSTGVKLTDAIVMEYLSPMDLLKCPEDLKYMFKETREKYAINRVSKGSCYPCFSNTRIATSMITKDYTLGTFHHDEMWDQLRPLLGYFGNRKSPYCVRVRSLHDDFDFSSSEIHCAQHEGSVIGVINYACDRGDTHICLDNLKDKKMMAKDMRIRFEITGDIKNLSLRHENNILLVKHESLDITFMYDFAKFDGIDALYEVMITDDYLAFDAVMYHGEMKEIHFDEDEIKCCAFSLQMGHVTDELARITVKDNKITTEKSKMHVTTRCKSGEFPVMNIGDLIMVNGTNIEDVCEDYC